MRNPLPRLTFAQKLGLTMSTLLIVSTGFVGYPLVYRQFSLLESQFQTTGETLVSQLAANAVELVFVKDELKLDNLVSTTTEFSSVVATLIINKDNDIISNSGIRPPADKITQLLSAPSQGVFIDTHNIAWFHKPIEFRDVTGGVAWVALDKNELIANQRITVLSALTFVALLVLFILFLALRLSRSLSRPIEDLMLAAHELSRGNLSFRLTRTHNGEFKQLTEAFNDMADGLQQKLRLERNFSRFVSSPVADHFKTRDATDLIMHSDRVEASIIFVDLVNYTGFSQENSPEQVADVLNFYFSNFADICHSHSGNVDKFIGDCAMLVFGCPKPDSLHRHHALQCAVAIRDNMLLLNQHRAEQQLPFLNVRIGLASGSVLAGLLGSPERLNYTVVGAAANLAARLCDKAPEGQILTDRSFIELLNEGAHLNTHSTQQIKVKGFSKPIDTLVIDTYYYSGALVE